MISFWLFYLLFNIPGQRIPFDLTCFYSPSEESSDDENGSDMENVTQKKTRKRRLIKRKPKQVCIDVVFLFKI
jgi:hypothetical protein